MNTPDSQAIVKRFFQVVNFLKARGDLKVLIHFTEKWEIPRRAFYNSEKDPASNRFQVCWISYLEKDFPGYMEFIITGKGKEKVKIPKEREARVKELIPALPLKPKLKQSS